MATATIQKAAKKPFESVKLNAVLANLNAEPRLQLRNVKQLKVTYAYRNDHFGARYVIECALININLQLLQAFCERNRSAVELCQSHCEHTDRESTQDCRREVEAGHTGRLRCVGDIFVSSLTDSPTENGQTATIDMHQKWSTAITKELMDLAGGEMWKRWVKTAVQKGTPILPGEEKEETIVRTEEDLPSLQEYRETPAAQALAAKRAAAKAAATKAAIAKSEQRKAKKASPGLASPSEPTPA